MSILNETQTGRAIDALRQFLTAPLKQDTGKTFVEEDQELDRNRWKVIEHRLLPLVSSYLTGQKAIEVFKSEIDSINKQDGYWGFKGVKGQMFFNLLYNACGDVSEFNAELSNAMTLPENEELAKSRIRNFVSYVRRIGDAFVEGGGSKHARPKQSSIPFFLSYFWQIQAPEKWPVYYTNSVQVITDLNIFQPQEDLAECYIDFSRLHWELREVFAREARRSFTLFDVEHVWWYVGDGKQAQAPIEPTANQTPVESASPVSPSSPLQQLPDSYVPPIISVIPRLAANDSQLEAAAAASGISIPRALEKSINAAFTILGFETKLQGQGQGRTPDGLAIASDHAYAVLWDAKARQNAYSMGTDDRAIREYITTQSRELKRRRHLRNLYYLIISSRFQDDFDDLIRGLKMDTDINEICLMESEALLVMVDLKLRDPAALSLGPDGMQRLFCKSGILNADTVREELA